ncbi:putative Pectin lyase fold/virulence factor [Seiridium cardinale]
MPSPATTTATTTATTLTTVTSTLTGPATTATGTCSSPNYFLLGYGAGTTGGDSGSGTTVTSSSALETAIDATGVIKISGVLDKCGILDVLSDTTIISKLWKELRSHGHTGLTNGGFRVKKATNIILQNLSPHIAPESKDLIELQYSTNLFTVGLTGEKDDNDGLLDITHVSDKVTISWIKFHDHVNSGLPSIRFGTVHVYSSCYEDNPTSGIHSRMGAQALAEKNYFLNTKLALVTNLTRMAT